VAVVFLVLGAPSALDDVALALHDPMDAARRTVLTVVIEATSQLPLLALTMTLVDVATGVATTPVPAEVGT
jgi:hypothetical protein